MALFDQIPAPKEPQKADRPSATCSAAHPGCDGCQWRTDTRAEWCLMFRSSPLLLPCTQHDKFKETRDMLATITVNTR
jgi:hypothetical protein